MKSIVISIRPEHALDILKGDKKLELRKSVPKGFVGWVYGYVTKGGEILYDGKKTYLGHGDYDETSWILNGTIPFRFWFEDYIAYEYYADDNTYFVKRPQDFFYGAEGVLKRLCLSRDEFKTYGKGKDLYAWHIKKLEIFDKPMGLMQFYEKDVDVKCGVLRNDEETIRCYEEHRLTKAPQSYQYVWLKGESNE